MNKSKNKKYQIIIAIQSIVMLFLIGYMYINDYLKNLKVEIQIFLNAIIGYAKLNVINRLTFFDNLSVAFGSITDVLNNREIAILIFSAAFVVLILSIGKIRSSFLKVLKSLFVKQFVLMYFLTILFTFVMVLILERIGFWEVYLLKETITWFILVGIISNFKAIDKAKDTNYFKKVIKDNFSIMITIPFIANLYSFSILYELILLGMLIVFSASLVVIETQPTLQETYHNKTKTVVTMIISIISIFYLGNSIRGIIINFEELDLLKTLKSMVLPSILSSIFVLFNLLYVLYARYQIMFIRIGFKKIIKDKIRPYLYLRIILVCNVQLTKIDRFLKDSDVLCMHISNIRDVNRLIKSYKNKTTKNLLTKMNSTDKNDDRSLENRIFDYIESYDETYSEFEIFINAANEFQVPVLEAYYLYSKYQSEKYNMPLISEAESKFISFMGIKSEPSFSVDEYHTWYYNGTKIRMGEIPPIPKSMEKLEPFEGKAICVELSCSINGSKLLVKTNLPNGFILHLTTNITKSFLKGEVKNNQCIFDIPNGTKEIKLTSPIISIMKNLDKDTIGEKGRNLVGDLVKFDPFYGKQIEWECSLIG